MNAFQRENLIDAPWARIVEKYHSPYKFDWMSDAVYNLYEILREKFEKRIKEEEGKIHRSNDGTPLLYDRECLDDAYIKPFEEHVLETLHVSYSHYDCKVINIRDRVADNYPMKYLMSCYF